MHDMIVVMMGFVVLKAWTIGSEFSFYHWFKYGKRYMNWYTSRPEFNPNIKPVEQGAYKSNIKDGMI